MADTASKPQFVAPREAPAGRADRRKAWILAAGTILIGLVGLVEIAETLGSLPAAEDDLFCIEEYAAYGLRPAFEHAVYWVVAFVWSAFAALALLTYSRTSIWRTVTVCCATGLFAAGMLASFFIVTTEMCYGS